MIEGLELRVLLLPELPAVKLPPVVVIAQRKGEGEVFETRLSLSVRQAQELADEILNVIENYFQERT